MYVKKIFFRALQQLISELQQLICDFWNFWQYGYEKFEIPDEVLKPFEDFSKIAFELQPEAIQSQSKLQDVPVIVPNLCPCCGAPFDPNDLKCEYCGVSFRQEGQDTVKHRICFFADDRIVEWEDPQL